MNYSPAFLRAVNFVLSKKVEGELSMDPDDTGNWTGGAKGKGELKGTKYGISAASYPQVDIAGLRREEAVAIYFRDFWAIIKGDELPPRVAIPVFDCAVNQGVAAAGQLLQQALKFKGQDLDGEIGPQTVAATRRVDQDELLVELFADRALRYTKSQNFSKYGHGWLVRLFRDCMEVAR